MGNYCGVSVKFNPKPISFAPEHKTNVTISCKEGVYQWSMVVFVKIYVCFKDYWCDGVENETP